MKTILLATAIALFTLPSFAQMSSAQPAAIVSSSDFESSPFGLVLGVFKSLEIQSLVEDMKMDGVKERKFSALLGVNGRIATVDIYQDGEDSSELLPFTVKIAPNNSVHVTVAAIDFGD